MMRKFEAHITMPRDQSEIVSAFADTRWSYSAIDGDPVMGKQAYCYLTAYATDGRVLLHDVHRKSEALAAGGVTVLRRKVEEIVFDSKTGHDVLTEQGTPLAINAPSGTRVRFTNRNGYESQRLGAERVLSVDQVYTVDRTEIEDWSTRVFLREVPGLSFNSVMFEEVA